MATNTIASKIEDCNEIIQSYYTREWTEFDTGLYDILHIDETFEVLYNNGHVEKGYYDILTVTNSETGELDKIAISPSLIKILESEYTKGNRIVDVLSTEIYITVYWNRKTKTHKLETINSVDKLSKMRVYEDRFSDIF